MIDWIFDLLLAATLLWVAWRTLSSTDLFMAAVLFIVFGVLMALAWVRLNAPDIALAEAAIGAGLTGALVLDAVGHLQAGPQATQDSVPAAARDKATRIGRVVGIAAALFALGLAATLFIVSSPQVDLPAEVTGRLEDSGVMHPVTAVLLNFRSYDTLLEIAVLLLALLGVLVLRSEAGDPVVRVAPVQNSLLDALVRVLVPLMLLVCGYLLWAGAYRSGGAFQAGAVLAASGVLLRLAGLLPAFLPPNWLVRAGLLMGFAVFLAVALGAVLAGNALLQYPQEWAGILILSIEATLTISIGLILVSLFAAAPPHASDAEANR